jgi:hypothetical protein
MIDPVEAAPSDQISTLKGKIWIARLKTDRVAIFRASGSRAFRAAASIVLAAEASAVIALAVEDSVAVALAGSAVAASGADGKN